VSRLILASLTVCLLLPFGGESDEKSTSAQVDLKKMKSTFERLEDDVTFQFIDQPLAEIVPFLEFFPEIKLEWEEDLPKERITIAFEKVPLADGLQKLLDKCKWTYAVRPDGVVLLRPVRAVQKRALKTER